MSENKVIIRAAKLLIKINRIQNKSLFTYYVCVYYEYLLCIYKYTHVYIFKKKICMYMCVYIYIYIYLYLYIIYIIYKYFIYKSNIFFLNMYKHVRVCVCAFLIYIINIHSTHI